MSFITKKLQSLGLKKKKVASTKGKLGDVEQGLDKLPSSSDATSEPSSTPDTEMHDSPSSSVKQEASQHLPPSTTQQGYASGANNDTNSTSLNLLASSANSHHLPRLSLSDFEIDRTLGTGSFGRVHLVKLRKTGEYYALKVMKKAKIVELRQIEHTINERAILSSLKHPFIVELVCSFQDTHNIYFVMEFVIGGEIFSILRRAKSFPNDICKFYAAEVILAFEYLHQQDIAYRDLKPENLLINHDGHVKLTDFGFAKRVPGVTRTLCGTPEYLAPEIIRSKDYGKAVDWYALGILIFEMLSGYPPFYNENHVKLYEAVLEGNMRFPSHFDPNAVDLVRKLTSHDVSMRFGNLREGVEDIKNHPWFSGVNWQKLYEKKIRPPYIPKVTDPGDSRHFELYPEENILYEQLPVVSDPYIEYFRDF